MKINELIAQLIGAQSKLGNVDIVISDDKKLFEIDIVKASYDHSAVVVKIKE